MMGKKNPLTCDHYWVSTKDKHMLNCVFGCGATRFVDEPKIVEEFQNIEFDDIPPLDEYEDSL